MHDPMNSEHSSRLISHNISRQMSYISVDLNEELSEKCRNLQKRNNLCVIFTIVFCVGCIVSTTFAILLWKQKTAANARIVELERKIQEMEKKKIDAEINKHMNFSFLQLKNFSIDFQPVSIINDDQPSIETINLTHNHIQVFRDNNIPSLTELVLVKNPISNFINNSLPKLVSLNLSEETSINIKSFTDNILPLERLGGELTITNFSGNRLLKMKQLSNRWNDRDWDGVQIHHNDLPLLTSMSIDSKNLTVFKKNNLSSLEQLNLRNNPLGYFDVSAPQLIRLDLYNNKISQFNNFNLPNLEKLQLGINRLTRFENNLFPRLKELNLGYNLLSVLAGNYLPALVTLDASYNNLSDLSNNTINPNIVTLSLQGNSFTSVEYFTKSFSYLSELNLYSNPIPSVIGCISNLSTLYLHYCNMSNFSNNSFDSLKRLYLSANSISSFENNNLGSIEEIYLRSNLLTEFAITEPSSDSLKYLDLSYNNLTAFSNSRFPNLTQLHLQRNRLQQFQNNTFQHLQVLGLYYNPGLSSIFQDGNNFQRLKWLDISWTNITSIQGQNLKALEYMDARMSSVAKFENNQFPILINLTLQQCFLSSFANNTIDNIQHLDLGANQLSLISNNRMQSLQVLYLENNNFGDDIGDQIVDLHLVNLKTVYLSNNQNIRNQTLVAQRIHSVAPTAQIIF